MDVYSRQANKYSLDVRVRLGKVRVKKRTAKIR
jgi:hypothetical protein